MAYCFLWDRTKAAANLRKHGITFDDAVRVFDDPLRQARQDRTEGYEQRWQTVGQVRGLTLLLVAHTWTEADEEGEMVEYIRIISARAADRTERKIYEQQLY